MKKTKNQISANGQTLANYGITAKISLEKTMQSQIRQGLIDSKLDVSQKFTIPIEEETWNWMKQFISPPDIYWWEATYFIHSQARSYFIPDNQVQINQTWVIVEVDPHEHVGYHVDLERFRQLYIVAYILKNKKAKFVQFFRINPGHFTTLEATENISTFDKVSTLIFLINHNYLLQKPKENHFPFSFFYLYYSSNDLNGFPSCLKRAPQTIQNALEFSWSKGVHSLFQLVFQRSPERFRGKFQDTKENESENAPFEHNLLFPRIKTSKGGLKRNTEGRQDQIKEGESFEHPDLHYQSKKKQKLQSGKQLNEEELREMVNKENSNFSKERKSFQKKNSENFETLEVTNEGRKNEKLNTSVPVLEIAQQKQIQHQISIADKNLMEDPKKTIDTIEEKTKTKSLIHPPVNVNFQEFDQFQTEPSNVENTRINSQPLFQIPQCVKEEFTSKLNLFGWKPTGNIKKKGKTYTYCWESFRKNENGKFQNEFVNLHIEILSKEEKFEWEKAMKDLAGKFLCFSPQIQIETEKKKVKQKVFTPEEEKTFYIFLKELEEQIWKYGIKGTGTFRHRQHQYRWQNLKGKRMHITIPSDLRRNFPDLGFFCQKIAVDLGKKYDKFAKSQRMVEVMQIDVSKYIDQLTNQRQKNIQT